MALADILKEFINKQLAKQEIYSIVCKVVAVDIGARSCTCTPINGGAELQDVRIQADLNSTAGIFIEPVIDSNVIVSFLSSEIAFISLFTDIENIKIDVSDKITFNGGTNGAMVKIGDLVTQLNDIENKVNDIIATYNNHTHVETGGTTNATLSIVLGFLPLTTTTDIDNPNILQ